jgi:hypothetical protein
MIGLSQRMNSTTSMVETFTILSVIGGVWSSRATSEFSSYTHRPMPAYELSG